MKDNVWEMSKGEVSGQKVDEFIERMTKEVMERAKEELGWDEKHYPPIRVLLINEIKFQNLCPILVPRRDLMENDLEKSERLFSVFLNMAQAFDSLESEMKIMRSRELRKRDE